MPPGQALVQERQSPPSLFPAGQKRALPESPGVSHTPEPQPEYQSGRESGTQGRRAQMNQEAGAAAATSHRPSPVCFKSEFIYRFARLRLISDLLARDIPTSMGNDPQPVRGRFPHGRPQTETNKVIDLGAVG